MFICNSDDQLAYIQCMETLKAENRSCREMILRRWSYQMHQNGLLQAIRGRMRATMGSESSTPRMQETLPAANYFSEHRVAVYTCIIGNYDRLTIPVCKPNNIDYFVITDLPSPEKSLWNFLDVSAIRGKLLGLTAAEQSRWYKMHPHLLFPHHEYSIYLDGNITPVSDLTELIHRIGSCGIATHQHYHRNCVHQEAQAVLQRKKDTQERIDRHLRFISENSFPTHYGLADCGIIARKHHHLFCVSLMEAWWKEFLTHSRRDQISFPYLLFKNGVRMAEVTTLGSNRMHNDAFYISRHL